MKFLSGVAIGLSWAALASALMLAVLYSGFGIPFPFSVLLTIASTGVVVATVATWLPSTHGATTGNTEQSQEKRRARKTVCPKRLTVGSTVMVFD
jgi:hypothetical protein